MTIHEYIENDYPFYHVTGMENLPHILETGLKAKRCNAICVVRSCDRDIIYEIIRQITSKNDETYAIIKIIPSMFGITDDMICEDSVDEITAPLQNYIIAKQIPIKESDILIKDYKPDKSDSLLDKSKIISLEGYKQPPRPYLHNDLKKMMVDF